MKKTILRQTPGAVIDGLIYFRLGLWVGSTEVSHWAVNSGQTGAQTLRTYEDPKSLPGNMEPLPEGIYPLSGPYWAGEPGDYNTWFSNALGPVVIDCHAKGDKVKGYRGELRIHLDGNRSSAPGTAGCTGVLTMADLKDFINDYLKYKPTELVADYGLGTVPSAPGKSSGKPTVDPQKAKAASIAMATVSLNGKPIGEAEIRNGTTYPTMGTVARLLDLKTKWNGPAKTVELSDA